MLPANQGRIHLGSAICVHISNLRRRTPCSKKGQVWRAKDIFYLFRDGHQYEKPVDKLHGWTRRHDSKDCSPFDAKVKGGDVFQRELFDGRYGKRRQVLFGGFDK